MKLTDTDYDRVSAFRRVLCQVADDAGTKYNVWLFEQGIDPKYGIWPVGGRGFYLGTDLEMACWLLDKTQI